jgi:hypothetical protein
MKIQYRTPTVLEEMDDAISANFGGQRIDYFKLTGHEFRKHYGAFDKTAAPAGVTLYSYKGIPIEVEQ